MGDSKLTARSEAKQQHTLSAPINVSQNEILFVQHLKQTDMLFTHEYKQRQGLSCKQHVLLPIGVVCDLHGIYLIISC